MESGAATGDLGRDQVTRLTVHLTPRQDTMLRHEAHHYGVSISEMLRRLLDGWVDRKIKEGAK